MPTDTQEQPEFVDPNEAIGPVLSAVYDFAQKFDRSNPVDFNRAMFVLTCSVVSVLEEARHNQVLGDQSLPWSHTMLGHSMVMRMTIDTIQGEFCSMVEGPTTTEPKRRRWRKGKTGE